MLNTLVTPSRTTQATVYSLTYTDGLPTGCTCPGFAYRGRCRHITEHTSGGFEVYCDGCGTSHLRAVRADAGRAWVRGQDNRCPDCTRRFSMSVVPDWDARDARRAAEDAAAAAAPMGGVA